jgi:tetratricopeptide (TPR) repeat protein
MYLDIFSARHLEVIARGNLDELLASTSHILDTNPADRDALFVVGSVYASRGKWKEAVQFLERLVEIEPDNAGLLNDLSICYWSLKKADSCYNTLIRLLTLDASSWFTYDMLCVVCLWLGRSLEAVAYGEKAVQLGGSDYGEPLNNLGCAYMETQRYDHATAQFIRAIGYDETNVVFKENLARAYILQNRPDDAEPIINHLLVHSGEKGETYFLSALYCECKGNLDKAISELSQCLKLEPNHAEALRVKGRVYFKNKCLRESISSYILAEAMLAKLDRLDYIRMGDVYFTSKSFAKAIEVYEKSVVISPSSDAYCALGNSYFELGDLKKAGDSYSESLRLNPDHLDAHLGAARICTQEGNPHQALLEYKKCLAVQPNCLKAHEGITSICIKLGNLSEAFAEISVWLRDAPNDSDALFLKGLASARTGDTNQAIQDLEDCLQHTPQHKPALDLLIELRDGTFIK